VDQEPQLAGEETSGHGVGHSVPGQTGATGEAVLALQPRDPAGLVMPSRPVVRAKTRGVSDCHLGHVAVAVGARDAAREHSLEGCEQRRLGLRVARLHVGCHVEASERQGVADHRYVAAGEDAERCRAQVRNVRGRDERPGRCSIVAARASIATSRRPGHHRRTMPWSVVILRARPPWVISPRLSARLTDVALAAIDTVSAPTARTTAVMRRGWRGLG